jgi:hypothetical protein
LKDADTDAVSISITIRSSVRMFCMVVSNGITI